jgi:hypothetical protein
MSDVNRHDGGMKPIRTILFSVIATVAFSQGTAESERQNELAKPNADEAASKNTDLRRLLVVTRYEENFRVVFPQLLTQLKAGFPSISEEQWREFEAELKPSEIIGIAIGIYDKHFTHEEIKELLKFYESPLGKKTIKELPAITQEVLREGEEWGKRIAARIEAKEQKGDGGRATATAQPSSQISGETNRQRLIKPTSAMTQEEKNQRLREMGYDPAHWTLEEPKAADFIAAETQLSDKGWQRLLLQHQGTEAGRNELQSTGCPWFRGHSVRQCSNHPIAQTVAVVAIELRP